MLEENKIISFKSDTAERKRFFKAASFAHPAKMVLGLQIYLIEHYTKPGDSILDPMAGSGTALIGCTLGRNMVLVELEDKFVKMQQDNWEKIKSLGPMLGHTMGQATILQGDARNLDGLLADNIVFSPPYAEAQTGDKRKTINQTIRATLDGKQRGGSLEKYYQSHSDNNIGSFPYGEISAVISSPPYAESEQSQDRAFLERLDKEGQYKQGRSKESLDRRSASQVQSKNNIGNLPYGKADAVITSPPYEETKAIQDFEFMAKQAEDFPERLRQGLVKGHARGVKAEKRWLDKTAAGQPENSTNIGNLKSKNYLQAMLQVYEQCHQVLKKSGLLVLVTKNFIRDKKVVRLDLDTIKLCEQAGFTLKERLQRKLTQQSFWRILYYKKFPDVPKIEFEDILIFQRGQLALFGDNT